jgi:hypothetical protein
VVFSQHSRGVRTCSSQEPRVYPIRARGCVPEELEFGLDLGGKDYLGREEVKICRW